VTDATALPPATAETGLVELCTPSHLLVLMAHQLGRRGWQLRSDIVGYLNNAAAAPLAGLESVTISRLAKRVHELARTLLRVVADDPRQGMITCALFTLTLVDEGLFPDARNQAVLTSLLLLEEARAEGEWVFDQPRAKADVGKMLVRARLQGFYLPERSIARPPSL
jgi:hypothetical protein